METVQPKKKKKHVGLWIFLILLLLLLLPFVLLLVALYTGGFDIADVTTENTMPASERFAFSAADSTMDIRLNANDLLFLLEMHEDYNPEELQEQLAPYGLTLDAFAPDLKDGVFAVNAMLHFKGKLPLPVRAEGTVSASSNSTVFIRVDTVCLTKYFRIPAEKLIEKLRLDADALTFSIDAEEYHSRMEQLTDASVRNDTVVLTCSLGGELFREVFFDTTSAYLDSYYLEDPVIRVFSQIEVGHGAYSMPDEFTSILKELEGDPTAYAEFRAECLALAKPENAGSAFTGKEGDCNARFLPDLSAAKVETLRASLNKKVEAGQKTLLAICNALTERYCNQELVYNSTNFVYADDPETEVTVDNICEEHADFLSAETSRIALTSRMENKLAPGFDTPFAKMPKTKGAVTEHIDGKSVVVPVWIVKMKNGRTVGAYSNLRWYEGGNLTVIPLPADWYNEYLTSELIPCDEYHRIFYKQYTALYGGKDW